jgi:hypothetical protein
MRNSISSRGNGGGAAVCFQRSHNGDIHRRLKRFQRYANLDGRLRLHRAIGVNQLSRLEYKTAGFYDANKHTTLDFLLPAILSWCGAQGRGFYHRLIHSRSGTHQMTRYPFLPDLLSVITVCCLVTFLLFIIRTLAMADTASATTGEINYLNHYRKLVRDAPVTENPYPNLSKDLSAHARYLLKNYPNELRGSTLQEKEQSEDSTNRWYSRESARVAPYGIAVYSAGPEKEGWAVDKLMVNPIQRLQLLDPATTNIGYGEYCEQGECAGVFTISSDILGKLYWSSRRVPFQKQVKSAIEFPSNRAVVDLHELSADQHLLASCPAYSVPVGLPITIQFPRPGEINLSAYSVMENGHPVQACGYGSTNYNNPDPKVQANMRKLLAMYGTAFIIPRKPLIAGNYVVSVTINDHRFVWSFKVK